MDGTEIRIAAMYLVTKLPPKHADAIATLLEARRIVDDYLFGDRLPLVAPNSASSRAAS